MRAKVNPYLFENRVVLFTTLTILFMIAMYSIYGYKAIIFHLFYGAYAILLGEGVNYVEHYGLVREKDEKGFTESITYLHSWNASHRFSNYLLFRIQRHSDHHAHSYRPYQILRSFDVSPQLPFGYETCIILAMVPPLWRKVINPYVEALNNDTKISDEMKHKTEMLAFKFLFANSVFVSILTFV
jgi:alkane 1-monooxygenase